MIIPNKWNKKSGKEINVLSSYHIRYHIRTGTCINEHPINALIRIYSGFSFSAYFFNTTFIKMKNKMNVTTAQSIKDIARNGHVANSRKHAGMIIL
jgi:hypothetical protein